ncbi:Carbonic anhydrase [Hyella patelloides LEGE 07179]|uniref:Carbonic anhydrase n=1 Tax=Hyella patelloides LEGE 07179 TaxID=945734 RepID=A0A563W356_9CYAN|nr:carbonic anhydrase [Hyella patelloides]VEP18139.1 Carbonic anhydrase [Hyella patelloides LEGE 07179]
MKKLIRGLNEFRQNYVRGHQELLEQLSHGQKPRVLFIACSDSRVAPNLITNTDIGELFIIRNAGNIIPPYGAANGGEGGTLEYAIDALGIEQVIVCGHSHCGAMKGLLKLNKLQKDMPLVYDWLKHAEATRRLVQENYPDLTDEEFIETLVAENVLIQIDNLKTYPVVKAKLHQGKLKIYAWIYKIETGEVLAYDAKTHTYVAPQSQLPIDNSSDDIYSLAPSVANQTPAVTSKSIANLRTQLESLLAKNPQSSREAKGAVKSLLTLFKEAKQEGMTDRELQSYHALFSEPVQTWSQKIYSRH